MNLDNFSVEQIDSSGNLDFKIELEQIASLFEFLPDLIRIQQSPEQLLLLQQRITELFEVINRNDPVALKHATEHFYAHYTSNMEMKLRYEQIQRAKAFVDTVKKEAVMSKSLTSKRDILRQELHAILYMRKTLHSKEICQFLNDRYKSIMHESGLKPITAGDISMFLQKYRHEK